MATEHDGETEDVELGNGDSLSDRVDAVDEDKDETCSTDELRDRLDL